MKRLAWLALLAISCAAPRAQVSPVSMGPSKIRGTYVSATTGPATSGLTDAQLRATPVPVSGTVSIAANQSVNLAQVAGVATATGNGTNTGAVRVAIASDNTAFSVNATPVGTTTVSGTVTANQGGTWTVQPGNTANTTAWKVDGSAVTQPVSGTVTANAGTGTLAVSAASLPLPTGAATSANQTTLGSHTTKVNDGTNTAAVKAASTAAAATDPALVVAVSPNNTIPISAASLPLPTGAATSSNQTTLGSHTTKLNDGTNTAAVKAASTAAAATDPALVVAISPNNTPNVAVTSQVPGTGATNLGKGEDNASASGDTGVGILGVRKDTNATLTSADGDYTNLAADNYGVLSVSHRHPNAIRCTVTVSTATAITAFGGSCAAPGAGLSIYITGILAGASASGLAADAFSTVKSGTGGTCGTGTAVLWGAISAAANITVEEFQTPIKVAANSEICWINSTAGSKFLVVTGFIAP